MVAPPTLTRIATGDAIDKYLDGVRQQVRLNRLRPATADSYARDLAEFARYAGEKTILDDITGADISDIVQKFVDQPDGRYLRPENKSGPGRAPGTQERFRQALSRFFATATRDGWVQANPMLWADVKPKVNGGLRTARTALSFDQAVALLTHGPSTPAEQAILRPSEQNARRDRFILGVMMQLGVRVSELTGADLSDFTKRDGVWWWRVLGKGGTERHLPLSPFVTAARDAYLTERRRRVTDGWYPTDSPALIVTSRGNRATARDIQRLMDRAAKRVQNADLDNAREVTPHGLRHTAATIMLAQGWDVKVVRDLLGHISLATTGKYLDSLRGELEKAVELHPLTLPADTVASASIPTD